ncbi:EAL domain-containing protein [Sneathiella marina]|uniref:EAL domain-containing protein n=1 Tax=Sneathiella marina TaxID=2950108 RepID=A0ABY4W4P4_9PROT|nr:EAL domain-containing protein [Sneathiella marina]USG61957.1 EAL domain-containing protein [Sneathiella marina]
MATELHAHDVEFKDNTDGALGNVNFLPASQSDEYSQFLEAINNSVVHYQPIFDIQRQIAVGAEALLRTKTCYKGMSYPQIIQYAQDNDFVPRITEVVLKDVLTRARTETRSLGAIGQYGNTNQIPEEYIYTINISPACLEDQVCIDLVNQFLFVASNRFRLILELSECNAFPCDLLDDFHDRVGRDSRIKFAIDDFGVGQSRFENLNSPLVAWVKIDRSFLPVNQDNNKHRTFRAVVEFAQFFDCDVVIEGIETKLQLDLVSQLEGVTLAQGYLLARPAP